MPPATLERRRHTRGGGTGTLGPRRRFRVAGLVLVTGLGAWLCLRLAWPLLGALTWAVALAVLAGRLHRTLLRRLGRPGLAAGLATVLVALGIVGPVLGTGYVLVQQVTTGLDALGTNLAEWQDVARRSPGLAAVLEKLERHFGAGLDRQLSTAVAARAGPAIRGFFAAAVEVAIALFALFYLFRDGGEALAWLREHAPLTRAETDRLLSRVADTIHMTALGTIAMAALQGFMGGLIFALLGLPAPVLWGSVMAMLAAIPVLGTFVVWAPAAVLLALQGSWVKGLVLAAWGVVVISTVDNLLYPMLVGRRLRLHTLVVFVSLLGGLYFYGAAGVFLGPVMVAVTLELVEAVRVRLAEAERASAGAPAHA